jgi:uncharacterized DUF497 family protein/predicted DNA binding CopG/RHH family protein
MSRSFLKHAVSQAECEQLFFCRPLLIVADEQHSLVESRYLRLGQTLRGRLLLVVFTRRGSLARVISARPMSRREREVYRDAEAEEEAIPRFDSEAEERAFWMEHHSSAYVDWSAARRVGLPNLAPSTETISLRPPASMLEELKILANERDVPYQSLLKVYLAERIATERKRKRRAS